MSHFYMPSEDIAMEDTSATTPTTALMDLAAYGGPPPPPPPLPSPPTSTSEPPAEPSQLFSINDETRTAWAKTKGDLQFIDERARILLQLSSPPRVFFKRAWKREFAHNTAVATMAFAYLQTMRQCYSDARNNVLSFRKYAECKDDHSVAAHFCAENRSDKNGRCEEK